ncbi:MAG: protoporphyrinogen oxidase [Burkholderiales bacterium]|nr:protoporphyrinogen oxidase [Burkholderiales bacterium]
MSDPDVIVLGGGVSGLAAAWWVARAGYAVELWERDARLGGKIATRRADGYLTERAASMLLNFRPEVSELLAATGLDAKRIACPSGPQYQRYLVRGGRLMPVPMRMGALMRSPLWSLRGKLRVLAEPLVPAGGSPDETVSEFVVRRLGREVLETAMEPFIAGPLASDADRASAHAVLPRLVALEQRYGSLVIGAVVRRLLRRGAAPVREMFSFDGGMATLIGALATTAGVRFRARSTALRVERTASGWRVDGRTPEGEQSARARHLVLSVPAPAAAALVRPLDAELGGLLGGIDYGALAVVHLAFDRSAIRHRLDGLGFLAPRSEGVPLTGCQWMSSMFASRAPRDKALLSCYVGGARAPHTRDWTDGRCIDAALTVVGPLLGIDAAPQRVWLDRHAAALPLYHGAYAGRLQAIGERLRRWPGLHVAANYAGGVSVRDRIACARALARRIDAALAGLRTPAAGVTLDSTPEAALAQGLG